MRSGGGFALLALLSLSVGAAAQAPPEIRYQVLGSGGTEARLGTSREHLVSIMRLVGLDEAGEPITVVLAPEDSETAREAPSWIAGFAVARSSTVVLFPARSPVYPHESLESVLDHEIAHVLIARAAGGRAIPRWFNEGLATVAERSWDLGDRQQLAWALVAGAPATMDEVDALFQGGQRSAAAAYALSTAFVRYIMETHGGDVPARLLAERAAGATFDAAFLRATGVPLPSAEALFRVRLRSWERWVPLLTSPVVLWIGVTFLALYAIRVARRRRAESRRRWDDEEASGEPRDASDERVDVPARD